jgi:hypothetical protein
MFNAGPGDPRAFGQEVVDLDPQDSSDPLDVVEVKGHLTSYATRNVHR